MQHLRPIIHIILLLGFTAGLAACGGGGGSSAPANPPADEAVWDQSNWDEKNWQ